MDSTIENLIDVLKTLPPQTRVKVLHETANGWNISSKWEHLDFRPNGNAKFNRTTNELLFGKIEN